MRKFEHLWLDDEDMTVIRKMLQCVDEGDVSKKAEYTLSSGAKVNVYSMGDNNPTIRMDLKRRPMRDESFIGKLALLGDVWYEVQDVQTIKGVRHLKLYTRDALVPEEWIKGVKGKV